MIRSTILLFACVLCQAVVAHENAGRVILYDEGVFGKFNLHDLPDTPVTTYSPLVWVKSPVYVSEHAERMAAYSGGTKHFYMLDADRDDSRYLRNFLEDPEAMIEGDLTAELEASLKDNL